MNQSRLLFSHLRRYNQTVNPTAAIPAEKPWIGPVPGSRKPERLAENAGAADILLTEAEVQALDKALAAMELSPVFGGTPMKK